LDKKKCKKRKKRREEKKLTIAPFSSRSCAKLREDSTGVWASKPPPSTRIGREGGGIKGLSQRFGSISNSHAIFLSSSSSENPPLKVIFANS